VKAPLKLRIKVGLKGVGYVMRRPAYLLIAFITSMFSLGILLWSLNIDLLGYILFESPLNIIEKLDFIFDVYGSILTNYESFQAMVMVLFSVLFGINVAVLTYVIRGGQKDAIKSKSSVGGLSFAVIGGGCIACGTSIITPLLVTLGVGSSIALTNTIGMYLNLIGVVLIIFSLISLGQRAATIQATQ
jgi:hypothetical protein